MLGDSLINNEPAGEECGGNGGVAVSVGCNILLLLVVVLVVVVVLIVVIVLLLLVGLVVLVSMLVWLDVRRVVVFALGEISVRM